GPTLRHSRSGSARRTLKSPMSFSLGTRCRWTGFGVDIGGLLFGCCNAAIQARARAGGKNAAYLRSVGLSRRKSKPSPPAAGGGDGIGAALGAAGFSAAFTGGITTRFGHRRRSTNNT